MCDCCSSPSTQGPRGAGVVLDSVIQCPHCRTSKAEQMPADVHYLAAAAASGRRRPRSSASVAGELRKKNIARRAAPPPANG